MPSESRQKIALVCRALQKRRPLLAFKVPLKRKLSSSPRPDKGKEIRLITSGGEIPQPRCPGAGRLQPDCWGRPGNLPKGLGQNGSELEAPVLAGWGGQCPCPQMRLTQCPLGTPSWRACLPPGYARGHPSLPTLPPSSMPPPIPQPRPEGCWTPEEGCLGVIQPRAC